MWIPKHHDPWIRHDVAGQQREEVQGTLPLAGTGADTAKMEIQQMMFVAGEIAEPLLETTGLVEDIVRDQVIEMVASPQREHPILTGKIVQATSQAARRGSKSISVDDLIFLIRHDRAKVNRLRTYLSWKDVRKKAREDGKDDGQDVEVEDLAQGPEGAMKARKKARVRLPWDVSNMFSETIPDGDSDEDEEAIEANAADLERLKVPSPGSNDR
jgi:transcription initiation protein SPT3